MLQVSLIGISFSDIIYESNTLNDNFNYLTFDGYDGLISRQQIFSINDDIIFRLNNGSSNWVSANRMQE